MANDKALHQVMTKLGAHLMANMTGLQSARVGFPSPNDKLVMPCLTIFPGTPDISHFTPYVVSKGATQTPPAKTAVRYAVAQYDVTLQIDLWCGSELKRAEMLDQFMSAMNPNLPSRGLELQMTDYFNEWISFAYTRQSYPDSEESSQRREYRATLNVLTSFRHIIEKLENLMVTIEDTLDITEEIPATEEDPQTTII